MIYSYISSTIVGLSFAVSTAFGAESLLHSRYAVKDTHRVPSQWARLGPAPAEHLIKLQIGLKQSQFNELERHLYEVSDPNHHRYGQHLSQAQINELVKPDDNTLAQVEDWLFQNGLRHEQLEYSPAKDWIRVTLPVISVETLLNTKYSIFKHEDGTHLVRTSTWSLPENLHEHIETIQPTNSFLQPRAKERALKKVDGDFTTEGLVFGGSNTGSKSAVSDACNITAVTSKCLRTLYGTIEYKVQSADENKIGLTNYLDEINNHSDISLFLQRYRPDAVAGANNFTTVVIADGNDEQSPLNATQLKAGIGLEGNLDAETIIGITFPTPLTTYNTGGHPPFTQDAATLIDSNEPYLTWVQYMLEQDNIPQVISTSYGDDEQTVPLSFAISVCNSFAQLGARGVTLLFSSGDNGVGKSGKCQTNDGKNITSFLPDFPASCPYVTAVGGTKNIEPEIVAFDTNNNFASGGGFSNYFPRPSYQAKVVPVYIDSLNGQFDGLYNASGRGYPDIAAQGYRYVTVWNGSFTGLDGTSASSPTAASVVSLVNDALLAAGKPVLGFMNPWLYAGGYKAFTDITSGSAVGCNASGFPAAVGWDAVTGFGTPYFPKFQAAAMDNGVLCSSVNLYSITIAFVFAVVVLQVV